MIDYIWEKNKKHRIYRWFFWIQLFWIVANGGDIMPDISNGMRTPNTLASQLISYVKTRCSILMRHNEFVSRLKSTRQPFFRLFVVLAQHCEIMSTTRITNTWHALALEHVCFLVCSFGFFFFSSCVRNVWIVSSTSGRYSTPSSNSLNCSLFIGINQKGQSRWIQIHNP